MPGCSPALGAQALAVGAGDCVRMAGVDGAAALHSRFFRVDAPARGMAGAAHDSNGARRGGGAHGDRSARTLLHL